MTDRIQQQDADYSPPTEGAINVVALVASTASAEQDTGILGPATAVPAGFVTFGCDAVFYLTFSSAGAAGSITDPSIAATSGDGRTMGPYPAGVFSLRVDTNRRYFKAISASASTLRWYLSSGPGVL